MTYGGHIPRGSNGPNSEGGDTIQIYEDDADPYQPDDPTQPRQQDQAEAALMGLELESARQAKQSLLSSFSRNNRSFDTSLNFADSPAKPRNTTTNAPPTPQNLHHTLSKQIKAATSRAEDAELALQALEGEVRALGFTSTSPYYQRRHSISKPRSTSRSLPLHPPRPRAPHARRVYYRLRQRRALS